MGWFRTPEKGQQLLDLSLSRAHGMVCGVGRNVGLCLWCWHIFSSPGVGVTLGTLCSPLPQAEPVPVQPHPWLCPSPTAQPLLCPGQHPPLPVPGVSERGLWPSKGSVCRVSGGYLVCAMPQPETQVWLLSGCLKKSKGGSQGVRCLQKCQYRTWGRCQCKSTRHFCLSLFQQVSDLPHPQANVCLYINTVVKASLH